MSYRLVLFDIDCTLVFVNGAGMRNLDRATREVLGFGFEDSGIRPDGMTDPSILRELLAVKKVPPGRWPEVEAEIWPRYTGFLQVDMAENDPLRHCKPGVVPLLERLRAHPGVHLGLLTGNLEATARIKLEPFGLNRYFPVGAFGSDCADRSRLGPIALERARRHYECDYNLRHVWIVGDTHRDVGAARAFGARALAVATGSYSRPQLEEYLPDHALDDLSELERVLELVMGE